MSAQFPACTTSADDARAVTDRKQLRAVIATAFELLAAGAPQKALAHIRPFTGLAGRSVVGAYVFGLIFFNADDPRSALGWFEQALALDPGHVEALAARAIVLQRLGQPQQALDSYRAVLELRPDDVDTMFDIGVTLQNLGQMTEALATYETVSAIDPGHVEALTHRGVLLERFQRFEDALAAFAAIEALRPDDTRNLVNKASVLQKLGRYEDALATYDAAARRSPQDPDTELGRGNLLLALGRFDEAIECYDRVLLYGHVQPQVLFGKGGALQGLGRTEAALEAFDAALDLEPEFCEALCSRAEALHELGRLAEAIGAYDDALRLRPSFVPALVDRATILLRCGRYQEALASCSDALRVDPDNARASGIRGAVLAELGRLDEASDALDRATRLDPNIAEFWLHRGNVLQQLDRQGDAVTSYEQALRVRPEYPEALSGLGVALKDLGRVDEALAKFDAALALRPSYADARNNRAGALLLSGMLKAGFDDFESRWERSNAPRKTIVTPVPTWDGGDLKGQSILVWDEQGLGDLVQFCRYLPCLVELGAEVTFLSRKNMHRLLSSLPGRIRLVDRIDESAAAFSVQCALMSLPRGFQTTLDTIPARVPYLRAESERVAHWAARIGTDGFRIGICWHGDPVLDLRRSIPLTSFAALAAIDGVRLLGLPRTPEPIVIAADGRGFVIESLGADFDAGPDCFVDCAAVMASLDLVVTADSSIAHLAGALGRPVLLALEQNADWRWLRSREDCPWYPTMRIFRQTRSDDWDGVLSRIAAFVAPLAAARNVARLAPLPMDRITVPVSVGELIDKITILEIKESRIADPAKLANIRHELALLRMVRLEAGLGSTRLHELETGLKDVNARLWQLRDRLRTHEAQNRSDAGLVDLAREFTRTDASRAGLKQAIDALVRSPIVEEKSYPLDRPGAAQ